MKQSINTASIIGLYILTAIIIIVAVVVGTKVWNDNQRAEQAISSPDAYYLTLK